VFIELLSHKKSKHLIYTCKPNTFRLNKKKLEVKKIIGLKKAQAGAFAEKKEHGKLYHLLNM
jgi:hypothetical protein